MSGVFGQWFLEISIDGTPILANPTTVPYIHIINNMHQNLPILDFAYKDSSGITDTLRLKDGTSITCSIGVAGGHIYQGLPFRMIGSPKGNPTDSSTGITIKAVLDNPAYMRKIMDTHVDGTSTALAQKIAGMAGLKFDGDNANDKMVWLPNRLPLASSLKKHSEKAWASDKSSFIVGVDDSGTLYYKDLDKLAAASATKTFSSNPSEGHYISFWSFDAKDQLYNNTKGYGSTSIGHKEDGTVDELAKIDMRSFAGDIGGSFMKNVIGSRGGRVDHLPIQSGNVHDNWNKAIHQNSRIKSMFSCDLVILTDTPSQVKMFDKVKVIPYDPATAQPRQTLVGDYIVTAFTRTIHRNQYYEKITLTTNTGG